MLRGGRRSAAASLLSEAIPARLCRERQAGHGGHLMLMTPQAPAWERKLVCFHRECFSTESNERSLWLCAPCTFVLSLRLSTGSAWDECSACVCAMEGAGQVGLQSSSRLCHR